ncbi:hypothetical protein H109_07952 [Trichophyton interdigitale MR816]|uniref:AB hydrolase-1 domain-containing protein n=1 Tax=Trichophyton interdigitale (strain MR816) TaxID=1215338 RepID=A0A059IWV3_TRIIM|nr:hypothetical protein H109_07952 [Trichophyton interdigitale MR816]
MPRFISPFDESHLFYRDYKPAGFPSPFRPDEAHLNNERQKPTLVFLHGWPMSSIMFEKLTLPLCETYRFRCIAPDRRGFGNSDWMGSKPVDKPIDYDVFAADLTYLLEKLDVGPFVFIGASMGPGEAVHTYMNSEYVRKNCRGLIGIGAALPYPLQTPENPTATSREAWDDILHNLRYNRPVYTKAALPAILGRDAGCEVSDELIQRYTELVLRADAQAVERCVQLLSSTDFTEKLKKLESETDLPITCLHGDKDAPESQVVVLKKIVPRTVVKMYENAAHGLTYTHDKRVIADILEFIDALEA